MRFRTRYADASRTLNVGADFASLPVLTGLRRVVEYRFDDDVERAGRRLAAVVLQFAEAQLVIEVNPDNDEAVLRVEGQATLRHWESGDTTPFDVSAEPRWADLIGADSVWRWQLTNQQGNRDGGQVHLTHGGKTTTRQWIAAASSLYEATVDGLV